MFVVEVAEMSSVVRPFGLFHRPLCRNAGNSQSVFLLRTSAPATFELKNFAGSMFFEQP